MLCGRGDQRSYLCLLRWQADSLPLSHREALGFVDIELHELSVSFGDGSLLGLIVCRHLFYRLSCRFIFGVHCCVKAFEF